MKFFRNIKDCRICITTKTSYLPFVIFITSVIAYLIIEYFFHINILSAAFLGIATYALIGMYIPYHTWKSGLLPTILIIQTLPFGNYLDIFLGFPLRIFSVELVEQILRQFNFKTIIKETIIVLENRASQVDLSCSGLKGLWAGLLFYFSITWVEKKRIDRRWFLLVIFYLVLIVTFNVIRIFILAVLELVFKQNSISQMVHVPLGITGFVLSSLIIWLIFKTVLKKQQKNSQPQRAISSKLSQKYIYLYILQYSKKISVSVMVLVIIINALIFYIANNQPQENIFELFKKDITKEHKLLLLENQDEIKKGLLNAYLAPYRYLSSTGDSNHVKKMFKYTFEISDDSAEVFQNIYNRIAAPFLYSGDSFFNDQMNAEYIYEEFFDVPIQKAEQESIMNAMGATYDRDTVEAGLLNINQKKVFIEKQEIVVNEHNDWAEIEIYEQYVNKTKQVQEIFYYFSLPESAVITGLWLSDDLYEKKKYAYIVATRGAARKVYKNQIRRRIDPALLEQVGPRQYRLRIFPVPAVRNKSEAQNHKMCLWLTYKCFATENNT